MLYSIVQSSNCCNLLICNNNDKRTRLFYQYCFLLFPQPWTTVASSMLNNIVGTIMNSTVRSGTLYSGDVLRCTNNCSTNNAVTSRAIFSLEQGRWNHVWYEAATPNILFCWYLPHQCPNHIRQSTSLFVSAEWIDGDGWCESSARRKILYILNSSSFFVFLSCFFKPLYWILYLTIRCRSQNLYELMINEGK